MDIYRQTVPAIFEKALGHKGRFIVFGDSFLTYAELKAHIGRFSTYFREQGIHQGDRVLFSSGNERFVCIFYLSLMANGITAVYIDPDSGPDRANAIIDHCDTPFIFADAPIQKNWNLYSQEFRRVTLIQSGTSEGALRKLLNRGRQENLAFPARVDHLPETDLPLEIDPEIDAYILFTSGTTSAPKGVRISYRALFTHLNTLTTVYQLHSKSRLFNNLILSHADGMVQGPLLTLFNAATLFRPFPFAIQNIEEIFDVIYSEKITHWVMVPTMIGLVHQFKKEDKDTLKSDYFQYVISCGGKLEALLWEQFEEKFETSIINGYGLTETVAGGVFAGPDPASHVIGTIGKPLDCEARIVGEDMQDKIVGEEGEIWLRGTMVMSGYLDAPEANAEVFSGEWLKTGDLGYLGGDGCFRITGRKKLVIISGGINVSPEEVTEVLRACPSVKDAATFGLEDPLWGEIVASALVIRDNHSLSREDLVEHCRKHLEENKIPKKIFFVEELPYGRSGKVIIRDIRERVAGMVEQAAPASGSGNGFMSVVSKVFKIPENAVSLDMVAEDTPEWDSISHLFLIAEMEKRYHIEFSPLEVMNVKKLADLFSLVENKSGR
jgi:long-chain acyl-CoA synthetase